MESTDPDGSSIYIGEIVTAPNGHEGIVRYMFSTPEGGVAVVKFRDDYTMQVLPVRDILPGAAGHR